MARISPEEWLPVGVDSLELAADSAVRATANILVTAGPGAGKTELLAQRACYLLQSGLCPAPKRILAVAFKRDAARNIAERVRRRCGEHARRFDSLTLDAFAKGLVDRFRGALPEEWRPPIDYEIMQQQPKPKEIEKWLLGLPYPPGVSRPKVEQLGPEAIKRFFEKCTTGYELTQYTGAAPPQLTWIGQHWWDEQLGKRGAKAALSFPMLSRLAALILKVNPLLVRVIRETYSYVFLDEFQDTTQTHYELLRACFHGSDTAFTAVGDSKQSIMAWAGALRDVFSHFAADFKAEHQSLLRNYRSAPALVRMQQVIAEAIEAAAPKVEPVRVDVEGRCELWEFKSAIAEASFLATWIENGIKNEGLRPRDFCILVRQKCDVMSEPLITALRSRGIRARDETKLQDLLSEPACELLLVILRLATQKRDPEAWEFLCNELASFRGFDGELDDGRSSINASRLIQTAREIVALGLTDLEITSKRLDQIVDVVGRPSLTANYQQYARGNFLRDTLAEFSGTLWKTRESTSSTEAAIAELVGLDVVPSMTIHKSKGLEFHTVVFLGLEDSSWWNFTSQSAEEKRNFFVAFSRAKERAIFTFSDTRDSGFGMRTQKKENINDLYGILKHAGVPTMSFRTLKLSAK